MNKINRRGWSSVSKRGKETYFIVRERSYFINIKIGQKFLFLICIAILEPVFERDLSLKISYNCN